MGSSSEEQPHHLIITMRRVPPPRTRAGGGGLQPHYPGPPAPPLPRAPMRGPSGPRGGGGLSHAQWTGAEAGALPVPIPSPEEADEGRRPACPPTARAMSPPPAWPGQRRRTAVVRRTRANTRPWGPQPVPLIERGRPEGSAPKRGLGLT